MIIKIRLSPTSGSPRSLTPPTQNTLKIFQQELQHLSGAGEAWPESKPIKLCRHSFLFRLLLARIQSLSEDTGSGSVTSPLQTPQSLHALDKVNKEKIRS